MAELNLKNFPADLLRLLKMGAADEGITLRELVITRLEAWAELNVAASTKRRAKKLSKPT
jgi:hypothetical protein